MLSVQQKQQLAKGLLFSLLQNQSPVRCQTVRPPLSPQHLQRTIRFLASLIKSIWRVVWPFVASDRPEAAAIFKFPHTKRISRKKTQKSLPVMIETKDFFAPTLPFLPIHNLAQSFSVCKIRAKMGS